MPQKTCPRCCETITNLANAVRVGSNYIHDQCVKFDVDSTKKAPHSKFSCVLCRNSITLGTTMVKMIGGNRWKHLVCPDEDDFEWHIAPTSRAICHRCKEPIAKDTKRAKKGKTYFHFDCNAPDATPKGQLSLAPTSALLCVDCGLVIEKNSLRYELPKGKWHHAECI